MAVELPTTSGSVASASCEFSQFCRINTYNIFQQISEAGAEKMECGKAKFKSSVAYRDNTGLQFQASNEAELDGLHVTFNTAESANNTITTNNEYIRQPETLEMEVVARDKGNVRFSTAQCNHYHQPTAHNVSTVTGNYNNVNHHYHREPAADKPCCNQRRVISIIATLVTVTSLIVTTVPLGVCYGIEGSCGSNTNEAVSTMLPPVENRTGVTSVLPQTPTIVATDAPSRAGYVHTTITPKHTATVFVNSSWITSLQIRRLLMIFVTSPDFSTYADRRDREREGSSARRDTIKSQF